MLELVKDGKVVLTIDDRGNMCGELLDNMKAKADELAQKGKLPIPDKAKEKKNEK